MAERRMKIFGDKNLLPLETDRHDGRHVAPGIRYSFVIDIFVKRCKAEAAYERVIVVEGGRKVEQPDLLLSWVEWGINHNSRAYG
jgi:hypothetical protein